MVRSKGILGIGLAMAIIGIVLNYFSGKEGIIHLQMGKSNKLYIGAHSDTTETKDKVDLNLILHLDSLIIHPHLPVYEIELMQKDTSVVKEMPAFALPPVIPAGQFALEPMKIRKIGNTNLRFRLKQFYPDFTFQYTYPEKRDTIKPVAPGILLELKTKEGPQIVTLRSDKKGPSKLGDIVGLRASFAFYWDLPSDSIMSTLEKDTSTINRVVFSGLDRKVYLKLNGITEVKALNEHNYYALPGQDSVGFSILYCVPDVTYLNASPSSKSQETHNPVANVEIWKLGGGAKEAFIYPESNMRKGGKYWIPDSDYMLDLAISQKDAVKYCDCMLSVKNQDGIILKSLSLRGGDSKSYRHFKFTPVAYNTETPDALTLKVTHRPGNTLIVLGSLLTALSFGLISLQKNKSIT